MGSARDVARATGTMQVVAARLKGALTVGCISSSPKSALVRHLPAGIGPVGRGGGFAPIRAMFCGLTVPLRSTRRGRCICCSATDTGFGRRLPTMSGPTRHYRAISRSDHPDHSASPKNRRTAWRLFSLVRRTPKNSYRRVLSYSLELDALATCLGEPFLSNSFR